MITEDYCSFEVAKLLKEKEFDERSAASYDSKGQLQEGYGYWNKTPIWYAAPTHQMAMKWLRKKDVRICPDYSDVDGRWFAMIGTKKKRTYSGYYDSYEETIEVALKYCLENLI